MTKNERLHLPLDVCLSKKFIAKSLGISISGIIFFTFVFLAAKGILFGQEYSSLKGMIISVIGTIIFLVLTLNNMARLFRSNTILTLNEEGLQIHETPYQLLGCISWKEIKGLEEIAFKDMYNAHGRKLCFAAYDLTHQINKITNTKSRKKIEDSFKNSNNWLFCVNLDELDCNAVQVKELITSLINEQKKSG